MKYHMEISLGGGGIISRKNHGTRTRNSSFNKFWMCSRLNRIQFTINFLEKTHFGSEDNPSQKILGGNYFFYLMIIGAIGRSLFLPDTISQPTYPICLVEEISTVCVCVCVCVCVESSTLITYFVVDKRCHPVHY